MLQGPGMSIFRGVVLVSIAACILAAPSSARVLATGPYSDIGSIQGNTLGGATVDIATYEAPVDTSTCSPPGVFPVGTTTVNCSDGSFDVTVIDTVAPTVNVPSNITDEATSAGGNVESFSVSATDTVDGTDPVTCDHNSGDTFPIATTTVTCSSTDHAGNTGTAQFTITVQDTTKPVISGVPSPITVDATNSSGAVVTYTNPTATDNIDGPVGVNCVPASGSTFPITTTNVNCSASDSHGNVATTSFTVTVQNTTPPTVNVPADITAEATGAGGAVVTFSVSATDFLDGTIGAGCTPSSGSTFPIATTTVNCSATDSSGLTGTASFHVTVHDTTPPSLTVPADITVPATGSSGAVVNFNVSASDAVDPSPNINCNHHSGDTYPIGTTNVSCTATDNSGNASGSKSFNITVTDATPPTITVPANITVEANGPSGSKVTYPAASAVDIVDGPLVPNCTPASGSTFPLGTTTVNCSATDSHGNTGTNSFTIKVQDTTPPTLITPPDDYAVYATSSTGVPRDDQYVGAYLHAAHATDIVDPHPVVTNDAPAFLSVGDHAITFTAKDASGNSVSKTLTLGVRPEPATGPGAPPPKPLPDTTPPGNVTNLTAVAGNKVVTLTWTKPTAKDFDHVVITRTISQTGAGKTIVYTGSGTKFVDHKVTNGVEYRYLVVSVDKSGNASAGVAVTATPKVPPLSAPKNGAKLKKPPTLKWLKVGGASYYNVQILRGNGVEGPKILSTWPVKSKLLLKRTWKFNGRKYKLTTGVYTWLVWAGFGPRSDNKYGPLLGMSTFRMTK